MGVDIGGMIGPVAQIASQAASIAVKGASSIVKSGMLENLFSAVSKGFQSVMPMAVEAIKKGGEFFTQLAGGNLFNIGSQAVQTISDTLKNIIPNLSMLKNIDYSQIGQFGLSLFKKGTELFSKLPSLLKGSIPETINPINVASSLADKIHDKIGNLNVLDSITKVNIDDVNFFGEFLVEKFQNIQDKFQGFLGNLGMLNQDGTMNGLTGITNQLKSTVSGFIDKIPGFNDFLNKVSGGALGADKSKNGTEEVRASSGIGKIFSSSRDMELTNKQMVEDFAKSRGIENTRNWGCLLYATTRKGVPCLYTHAKYAVADGCLRYKLLGFHVDQTTPRKGALLVRGTHAVYVESVNPNGTITISEANHHSDFDVETIPAPTDGYYVY